MKRWGFILGGFLFVAFFVWSMYLPVQKNLENPTLTRDMARALGVACLMACLWISEAIPIPATSLIPLAVFPMMGIMGTTEVGPAYANRMVLLLMGGFFIALVIEKVNLHKRIALNVIYYVGTNPRQLLLGFILATAILSMWISNTATTLMMFPIALAVVSKLGEKSQNKFLATAFLLAIAYAASIGGVGTPIGTPPNLIMRQHYENSQIKFLLLRKGDILDEKGFINKFTSSESDPLSSFIKQLIPTETLENHNEDTSFNKIIIQINEILQTQTLYHPDIIQSDKITKEQRELLQKRLTVDKNLSKQKQQRELLKNNRLLLDIYYKPFIRPHIDVREISFASWMIVAIPMVIILLFVMWLYMIWQFQIKPTENKEGKDIIEKELKDLHSMSYAEKITAILFFITSMLWVFRKSIDLKFIVIPGWSSFYGLNKCDDTTVAIFMAIVMFCIPIGNNKKLLDWETAVKIPWGMLLLFGGGIALAAGFDQTGLSTWLASHLQHIAALPTILTMLILCLFMTFITEITSNTAITTVMMPILASTALAIHVHPALLMMPAAISASFAFMLPVATAPNAIVYGADKFSISTMAKTGFALNLAGVAIVTIVSYFLGQIFIF